MVLLMQAIQEVLLLSYNHSDMSYHFKAGEKITQLVILPCYLDTLEEVDSFESTDRGDDGFGSTGK